MSEQSKAVLFRILKGTHVCHFHKACPDWPTQNFYELDAPLWWGRICEDCQKLADSGEQGSAAGA